MAVCLCWALHFACPAALHHSRHWGRPGTDGICIFGSIHLHPQQILTLLVRPCLMAIEINQTFQLYYNERKRSLGWLFLVFVNVEGCPTNSLQSFQRQEGSQFYLTISMCYLYLSANDNHPLINVDVNKHCHSNKRSFFSQASMKCEIQLALRIQQQL